MPEARSDSSAAALRGSDRDTAEGGAFTQTAPPQQCGCKPEGRSAEFRRRCHPLPREVGRDFRGGGRPSRQRWGRRHRVRRDTAADPADGGGEDLREAATGGSRRQAPCASCSTMDKHAYAQMRPVLSRRAQRASTTQPATGRPETIPPVERARANCLPYSQRRSLENAPDARYISRLGGGLVVAAWNANPNQPMKPGKPYAVQASRRPQQPARTILAD